MYQIISYYYEDEEKIAEVYAQSKHLWGEHICYTHNAIASILNGTKDIDAVSARLMKNQDDIAELLYPYHDRDDVEAYTAVLKEHVTLLVKLIEALKTSEGVADSTKALYDNSEAMLTWMEDENSYYWSRIVTKPLWNDHLKYTLEEITRRMQEDWQGEIESFDANHLCIHKWAELYATGIVYNNMELFSKKKPYTTETKEVKK